MATPYVTPDILVSAPTGMAWNTIPSARATASEQLAEQMNICLRATQTIDTICQQPLRATTDTEELVGPDFRLTVQNNGVARAVVSRFPILQVLGACVSPATVFPVNFQPIPVTSLRAESTLIGLLNSVAPDAAGAGPAAIDIAPGFISWTYGRNGYRLRLQYVNGWPHSSLTAAAQAANTTVTVDDCTGFTGTTAQIYDGGTSETIAVTAVSASTGPGQLSLASPVQFNHESGLVVSALPATVQWATILAATAEALTRGGMAVTAQALPGSATSAGGGGSMNPTSILEEVKRLVQPYRRIV